MRMALAALAAAALLAVPATAFPITSRAFETTIDFAPGFEGHMTLLSGALSAAPSPAAGPYAFVNTTGLAVAGVAKACWARDILDAQCKQASGLRLEVSDGGFVALHFPRPATATVSSQHSLAFFVAAGDELDFEDYQSAVGNAMVAMHVGGVGAFSALPSIPTTDILDLDDRTAAGLLILDDATTVRIVGDGTPRTVSGNGALITFQGSPSVAPFGAGGSVVPFAAASNATFTPAGPEAAQAGLDPSRLERMVHDVQEAFGGKPDAVAAPDETTSSLRPLLGAILGGALLDPPGNFTPQALGNVTDLVRGTTLFRFDSLTATATPDGKVALAGEGPLTIQGGRVVGAQGLIGVLPWWCWLLWLGAIGMWIARLVVKPPKEHPTWDQYRWVGWASGAVASILVLWLWDGEVHKVWGLSLMRGGGGGVGTVFLLLAEVLVGLLVYLAVVTPLSSLIKSGVRFGKQGRFMGLHRPVALLLGYLVGATLMLSYTDFLIGLMP